MAAFYNSETVDCGGELYTLVIDIGAIDAFERKADAGLFLTMERMEQGDVRLGSLAWLVWALLRAKHSGVTLDKAFSLVAEHGDVLTPAIMELVQGAFPQADEKAKGKNPPMRGKAGSGKIS